MALALSDLPYFAASLNGRVALFISKAGEAEVYVDDVGPQPISKQVAQVLASRWLDPSAKNRLIKQGFLPASAAARRRMALRKVSFAGGRVTLGSKAERGKVVVNGTEVFNLAMQYMTPVGALKAVGGTFKVMVSAASDAFTQIINAWGDNVAKIINELRKLAAEAGGLAFRGGAGASLGLVLGLSILGGVVWLTYGGGASVVTAAAAKKYFQ